MSRLRSLMTHTLRMSCDTSVALSHFSIFTKILQRGGTMPLMMARVTGKRNSAAVAAGAAGEVVLG
jgi:hypothetical protein